MCGAEETGKIIMYTCHYAGLNRRLKAMKRKIGITLLLVLLIGLVWCWSAMAEDYEFTQLPASGALDAGKRQYPISWETNFTPYKVEICQEKLVGYTYIWEPFQTQTTGLSAAMTCWVDGAYGGKSLAVRAYYGEEEYKSYTLTLGPADAAFTQEPAVGGMDAGKRQYPVSWETNFVPYQIEFCEEVYNGLLNEWKPFQTLTDGLSAAMSARIDGAYGGEKLAIRAYYGKTHYKSFTFTPQPADRSFSSMPESGPLDSLKQQYPVSWETSFTPYRIELCERVYNGLIAQWKPFYTQTTDLSAAMSCVVDGAYGGEAITVRAYYGEDKHISNVFELGPKERAFTEFPVSGDLDPEEMKYPVSWETNYTPYRIEFLKKKTIGYTYEWEPVLTLNSGLSKQMTRSLDGALGGEVIMLRAYYGNSQFVSHQFTLGPEEQIFIELPTVGVMDTEKRAYPVTWETNYMPYKIEFLLRKQVGYSYDWESLLTLSDGLSARMTYWIDGALGGETLMLRAYYGESNSESATFTLTAKPMVITFDPDGGTLEADTAQTGLDGRLAELPTPTRSGHLFRGWYIPQTGEEVTADTVFISNTTICARWERLMIVSFDAQGHGTAPETQLILAGDKVKQPVELEAEGWLFGGWYTDTDFNYRHRYYFSDPVTEDVTLYAWWGHTVDFDLNGGGPSMYEVPSQRVHEGDTARESSAYMDEGFNSWYNAGWYTEPECMNAFDFTQPVTASVTLYAKWEFHGSILTFDWNGRNISRYRLYGERFDIDPGAQVIKSYRETDELTAITPLAYGSGITFLGWYTEPECVNAFSFGTPEKGLTQTLYAGWAVNHTLILRRNGPGDWEGSPSVYTVPYDTAPSEYGWTSYALTHPESYTDYAFDGWYLDEACTVPFDADALLTANTELWRKWVPVEYTVVFDVNGGTGMENLVLTGLHYGDIISRPDTLPNRPNYVCNAWYSAEMKAIMWATGSYVQWTCTGDATFEAQWIPDGIEIENQYGNNTYFPDANFRSYVRRFDTNSDNYLSAEECDAVTSIDVNGRNISDLTGIGNFVKLQTLNCQNNALTALDMSKNTELTSLNCSLNQIKTLNLNNNTQLTALNARGNALTSVNAAKCAKLAGTVYLYDNPNLITLVLSAPGITDLEIQFTGITSLDLSGCPNLGRTVREGWTATVGSEPNTFTRYQLSVDGTYYYVHMSSGVSLEGFVTSGIPIDEARFPDAGFRRFLGRTYYDRNQNGVLSDSEIEQITSLSTSMTGSITGLYDLQGIEYLPNLSYISLPSVGLEKIDLSGNPQITSIMLEDNALTSVDVSMLPDLTALILNYNPGLHTLRTGSAPISSLSVRNAPNLRQLDLSGQPVLLKAYMEGEREQDGENIIYTYTLNAGLQTETSGTLILHQNADAALPEWQWNGIESASFILPDGSDVAAAIDYEINADGRMITYTATATLGGVDFTDSKTLYLITFDGAEEPAQKLEIGQYAQKPADPFRAGSAFAGWYSDPWYENRYYFNEPVSQGFKVYAKWDTPIVSQFIKIPAAAKTVESEAFAGIPAKAVIVPAGVTSIAYDAFYGSGVQYVYGFPGSLAETYANSFGFTFIPIDNAWLAGR